MKRKRLAIMISGRGSNMEAILKATMNPDYPAEVAVVIADKGSAGGLEIASTAGIPAETFERSRYANKEAHEAAISQCIDGYDIDLICLAGFMRILSPAFVKKYDGRIINIHPSLLPKFKGLDTHAQALSSGCTEHGCTVHYVNEEMDGGEIIAQARVPVHPGDTVESLAERVLIEEHTLYPAVIEQLCSR